MADLKEQDNKSSGRASAEPSTNGPSNSDVQALEQENEFLKQQVQTLMKFCQLCEKEAELQQTIERDTKINEELERENRAIQMEIEAMDHLFAKCHVFEQSSAKDRMDEYAVGRTLGIFLKMYYESPALPDEDYAAIARFTTRVIDTITRDAQEETNDA
ncbi:hypothetical protein NW762_010488 [Fusarium torreyae]|uniref:Uncharacterized protein n=1 Tax=Fusarium torreyae TaxID=1237075 RepID=A0A9W8VAN5_9HYPO|nr:hypothetical protein NW762_010488 [Fusarium torreyae]